MAVEEGQIGEAGDVSKQKPASPDVVKEVVMKTEEEATVDGPQAFAEEQPIKQRDRGWVPNPRFGTVSGGSSCVAIFT